MSRKSRRPKSKSTRAWPIELTKPEFDKFFYPFTTNVTSGPEQEHLCSMRLVEKLQDPEVSYPKDPPQEDIDKAEEKDDFWWPSYKLIGESHTFLFEEDEKKLALKRLDINIKHIPPGIAAQFEVVRQKVIEAKPIDVTPTDDDPVEE